MGGTSLDAIGGGDLRDFLGEGDPFLGGDLLCGGDPFLEGDFLGDFGDLVFPDDPTSSISFAIFDCEDLMDLLIVAIVRSILASHFLLFFSGRSFLCCTCTSLASILASQTFRRSSRLCSCFNFENSFFSEFAPFPPFFGDFPFLCFFVFFPFFDFFNFPFFLSLFIDLRNEENSVESFSSSDNVHAILRPADGRSFRRARII